MRFLRVYFRGCVCVVFHFSFYLVTRLVGEWVPWVANYECDTLSCSAGGYAGWGWEKGSSRGKPSWHGGNAPEGEEALIGVAKTP